MYCATCTDDFSEENTVTAYIDTKNCEFPHCRACTEYYIENQFMKFLNDIKKADCEASLKRSLLHKLPTKLPENLLLSGTELTHFKHKNEQIDALLHKPESLHGENLLIFQNRLDDILNDIDKPERDYITQIKTLFNEYNI
jgi:hypothetical protein